MSKRVDYCSLTPHPDTVGRDDVEPLIYDGKYVWFKLTEAGSVVKAPLSNTTPGVVINSVNARDYYVKVEYDNDKIISDVGPDQTNLDFASVELLSNIKSPLDVDEPSSKIITSSSSAISGDSKPKVILCGMKFGSGLVGPGISLGDKGIVADQVGPSTARNYGGVFQTNPLSFLPSFAFLPLPSILLSLSIFNQVSGLTSMTKDVMKAIKEFKNG